MSPPGDRLPFEPVAASSNPFVDLLLGVESRLHDLDGLVACPMMAPSQADNDGEVVDILLGLFSLRGTFGLVLRALTADGVEPDVDGPYEAATWKREALR